MANTNLGLAKITTSVRENPLFNPNSTPVDITLHTKKFKIVKNTLIDAPGAHYTMFELHTKIPISMLGKLNNYSLNFIVNIELGSITRNFSIIGVNYNIVNVDEKYRMIEIVVYCIGELTFRLQQENSLNYTDIPPYDSISNYFLKNILEKLKLFYGDIKADIDCLPESLNKVALTQIAVPQSKNNLEWIFNFIKTFNVFYPYPLYLFDEGYEYPRFYFGELTSLAKLFSTKIKDSKLQSSISLLKFTTDFDPLKIKILSEANYIIKNGSEIQIKLNNTDIPAIKYENGSYVADLKTKTSLYYHTFDYLPDELFLNNFRKKLKIIDKSDINTYAFLFKPYYFDIDIGSSFLFNIQNPTTNTTTTIENFVYAIEIGFAKKVYQTEAGGKNIDQFINEAIVKTIDLKDLNKKLNSI